MTSAPPRGFAALRIGALLAFALCGFAVVALFGYHLQAARDLPLVSAIGWPRLVLLAAAGAALGAGGALDRADGVPAARELYLFAVPFGAALVAGPLVAGGIVFGVVGGAVGALAGAALTWILLRPNRVAWVALALSPPAVTYGMLWAAGWGRGSLGPERAAMLWLLGDASDASWPAALAVLGLSVLAATWALRAVKTLGLSADAHGLQVPAGGGRDGLRAAAAMLRGLSIGAVGPVAFVGAYGPWLAARLAGPTRGATAFGLAALAGAVSLVLLDGLPRLLAGGLGYPINMQTWLVFCAPLVLSARQRLPAGGRAALWLERIVLALLALFLLAVIAGAAVLAPVLRPT